MKRYWLTPPELYESLDNEFHFDFDPCPCPRPANYNSLNIDWKNMNFVNPIFRQKDSRCEGQFKNFDDTLHKRSIKELKGPTAYVRKAIAEQKKGNSSFLTLPTQSYVNLLLEAGAKLRSLGRVKWLEVNTKEAWKTPSPITGFFLEGDST